MSPTNWSRYYVPDPKMKIQIRPEPPSPQSRQEAIQKVARGYAIKCHTETNHKYDDKPYEYHLNMAYDFAKKYLNLLTRADMQQLALQSVWLHDVIEDCRQTWNDVNVMCGSAVAEVVYLLTNNKGRNRQEREGVDYYVPISKDPVATFVKICDRLANVKHSKETNSRMLEMYRKEHEVFCRYLRSPMFNDMFVELDAMLEK